MSNKQATLKVIKADLINEMASISGLSKVDTENALNSFCRSIEKFLKAGKEVRLIGFGNFYVSKRAATVARNPRTGQEVNVPETLVPKFKAGKQLKDFVAGQ